MNAKTKRPTRRHSLWLGACALALASCGGDDGGGTGTTPPAPTPISISSGATATLAENATGTVYQVTTAGGSGTVTYTLGGADAALFAISTTGALTFRTPPDFETPNSAARSNTYTVTIIAADGTGQATRDVTVTVTNIADFTTVDKVGGEYDEVVHIAPVPGQARIFVAQRKGDIYLVDPTTIAQRTSYLTLRELSSDTPPGGAGRFGLLSVAAAPDFATSGTLYVLVRTSSALEVRRFARTSAGLGDPSSEDIILRVALRANTRNVGGWIGFGADGLLYATTGNNRILATTDDGSGNQTNATLQGKVLRIDPSRDAFPADPLRDYAIPSGNPFADGARGAAEVYAAGFQDPARASLDGGDLYVGDIDNTPPSAPPAASRLYLVRPADAGRTFGPSASGDVLPPVITSGQQTTFSGILIAGSVYRGPAPDLVGRLFFRASGRFPSGYDNIFTIPAANLTQGTTVTTPTCCTVFNSNPAVAFGEDSSRNLYYTDGSALFAIRYR